LWLAAGGGRTGRGARESAFCPRSARRRGNVYWVFGSRGLQ
jgi:hypothetical protein